MRDFEGAGFARCSSMGSLDVIYFVDDSGIFEAGICWVRFVDFCFWRVKAGTDVEIGGDGVVEMEKAIAEHSYCLLI